MKMVNFALMDPQTKSLLFGFMREARRQFEIPLEIQYIVFCFFNLQMRNNVLLNMKASERLLKRYYVLKFKNNIAYLVFKCRIKKGVIEIETERAKSADSDVDSCLEAFCEDITKGLCLSVPV